MEEIFKCDRCGNEKMNELTSYGPYGDDKRKIKDENRYCPKCFEKVESIYRLETTTDIDS